MRLPATSISAAAAALTLVSSTALAQNAAGAPADTAAAVAAQPSSGGLPFAFSGVLYANYQYGGAEGRRSENRFDLERAYLNFRAAAGDRDTVRVTLDVFQQRDASRDEYYRGWTMRVKYAYLQHELIRGPASGLKALLRLGLLHTVVIEKEEQTWQRGLSQVATELAGYFSSSDAGLAASITLPNRAGEVYATIVNGPGYTSRETDRFKDYQARLTLSPFASGGGVLAGLEISPWLSSGARSSDFVSGRGTVRPVADGLRKDRYGLLVQYRNPRFLIGANLARKVDIAEQADTTSDVAPTNATVTGNLFSAHLFVRPALLLGSATQSPVTVVLRADHVRPDIDVSGSQRRYITGVTYDLNRRTSVTLDLQSLTHRSGLAGTNTRTLFLHLISNF